MLACIPFAWAWMMPDQLRGFSQSLAAVALFSSNMLFWRTSGYFEPAAEVKPLLHTPWSHAVEEQYYVLFPLFILLTWRLGLRRIPLAAGTDCARVTPGSARSLGATGRRQTSSLAPTRAWEILTGSMLDRADGVPEPFFQKAGS